ITLVLNVIIWSALLWPKESLEPPQIIITSPLLSQQPWGQTIVNIFVWLFFLALLKYSSSTKRLALMLCLVYATIGEVFLSLVWQLYEYRLHNIPLFIPPGHALLFTLGLILAPKIPDWSTWLFPIIIAVYTIFVVVTGIDTLGGILFIALLLCLVFGKAKKLYITMFLLSLVLEIYGTTVGNWTWNHDERWFGMVTTNPPVNAGAFYCMLDLLIVSTMAIMKNRILSR
ncbi:hypothetical protein QUF50_09320, partial [Thiotrichales bacterium HSG1]|nr:hypothetical protein [Thiotrichales bacterium HSG1]